MTDTPLRDNPLSPSVPEVIPATVAADDAPLGARTALVAVQPTQVRRPWKATIRTGFQALLALAVLLPLLIAEAGLDPASIPWLGTVVIVAATFSRIMALPQVEAFLRTFLPFLSAAPKEK